MAVPLSKFTFLPLMLHPRRYPLWTKSCTSGCTCHALFVMRSSSSLEDSWLKMSNLCSNVVPVTSSRSTPPHAINSFTCLMLGARLCRRSSLRTKISKRFWNVYVPQKGCGESSEEGGICRKSPHSNIDQKPYRKLLPDVRM